MDVAHLHLSLWTLIFFSGLWVGLLHLLLDLSQVAHVSDEVINDIYLISVSHPLLTIERKKADSCRLVFYFAFCCSNKLTKSNLTGKGVVWCTHLDHSASLREVVAGAQAEPEVRTTEEPLLGFPALLSRLAHTAQLPKDSTAHSGPGAPAAIPAAISNQENVPLDPPTGQSDGGDSSAGMFSSYCVYTCVKSTETK